MFENGEYRIDSKHIKLRDGFHTFFSNLSDSEKMKTNPYENYDGPYSVQYEQSALGDLNGDGVQDGVVALGVNYGGTGQYIHLAAILFSTDGTYRNAGDYAFEDRDVVRHLSIRNGIIEAESIVHSKDDPLCCPSIHITKKLTLENLNTTASHFPQ